MDGVIKFILCDSYVLARIIKGTVQEAEGYTLEEIRQGLDLEDDGRTVRMLSPELICRKGKIVYDVLTELRLGGKSILIGVEAQGRSFPDILWRQVVYSEGLSWYQHFVLSRGFAEMCSAYSIWLFFNPRAGNRNTIVRHASPDIALDEDGSAASVFDKRTGAIVDVNLGDYLSAKDDLCRFMDLLLSSDVPTKEKERILREDFNLDLFDGYYREVLNTLATFFEDYKEGLIEVSREEGRMEGLEEGRMEGLEEGRMEGLEEGRRTYEKRYVQFYANSVLNIIYSTGWSLDKALEVTHPPDEIFDSVRSLVAENLSDSGFHISNHEV